MQKWQVIIIAVLKHIASKNADYSQIIDYMLFQHDEITMKPILDENGRMILRDEYYLDGINCEAMLFDKECEKLNASYHKNQHYDDIKSHHYILSFDPKDKDAENRHRHLEWNMLPKTFLAIKPLSALIWTVTMAAEISMFTSL